MKKALIPGFIIVLITMMGLAGCGGSGTPAPRVQTLTVSGTVDSGVYTSGGISKSVKAVVTAVRVSVYDFETSHLYGTANTDGGGGFSVSNIPVGADLLILVTVTDTDSVVHRYSCVVAHVTLENANAIVDVISSAVSEVLGKLYNKGIDLDPALLNNIDTQIRGLGHGFRCVPGDDIPANYGEDIPDAELSNIQTRTIMDSAYMKGLEIINHMKYSFAEFGFAKNSAFYMLPESFYPLNNLGKGIESIMSIIPDVVYNQKIFYLTPGTYTLDQVESAAAGSTELTGSWTLTFPTSKTESDDYRFVLARTNAVTINAQIYENCNGTEYHLADVVLTYDRTNTSTKAAFDGQISIINYFPKVVRGKGTKTGDLELLFDKMTATGSISYSVTQNVGGSISFNGSTTFSNAGVDVYTANGSFGLQESSTSESITFSGNNDGPAYSFQGEVVLTGVVNSATGQMEFGHATADLTQFEYKGKVRNGRSEVFPFAFSGKIDIRLTNAATLDWAAWLANGPTADNYLTGNIALSGRYTSEGHSAGESFISTLSETGFNTGSFNTEVYYDLNNQKKIDINISTSPTVPFNLAVTSTIGAQLNIARAVDKTFSGNVIVDGTPIGTVQSSATECTISFVDGKSVTIYSEF